MKSLFLSAITEKMRMRYYAEKTIKAYWYWIKLYIFFAIKSIQVNVVIKALNLTSLI